MLNFRRFWGPKKIAPASSEPVIFIDCHQASSGVAGQGLPFLEQLLTLNIQWMLEVGFPIGFSYGFPLWMRFYATMDIHGYR